MKKLCSLVLFLLFLSCPSFIFASGSATFSSIPSAITIGEEFAVNFAIDSLSASASYYLKSRVGPDSSHLTKGQTKSPQGDWLFDGESWASGKFPVFSTDENGRMLGVISSRVSPTVGVIGKNIYILRALKLGEDSSSSENIDGSFEFEVSAGPTSTPDPSPTPTRAKEPTMTLTPTPRLTQMVEKIVSKQISPSPSAPTDSPEEVEEGDIIDGGGMSTESGTYLLEPTAEVLGVAQAEKSTNKLAVGLLVVGFLLLAGTGVWVWYTRFR